MTTSLFPMTRMLSEALEQDHSDSIIKLVTRQNDTKHVQSQILTFKFFSNLNHKIYLSFNDHSKFQQQNILLER